MNKRQTEIVNSYNRSNWTGLFDCYGSVSKAKNDAWNRCVALMNSHDGSNLRVIGRNGYQFSAGFKCKKDGKQVLCYITKAGIEYIPME